MPELPEVELIRRGLLENLKGNVLLKTEVYEPYLVVLNKKRQESAEYCEDYLNRNLKGKTVTDITRKGKLIAIQFDDDVSLLFHLKMTGSLVLKRDLHPVERYERVRFFFSNFILSFSDKRKFGFVELLPRDLLVERFGKLGRDALNELLSPDELKAIVRSSRMEIKKLLMDQTRISGIGNAYASEILHEAGILPTRSARSLNESEINALFQAIKNKLRQGIESGGLTLRDFRDSSGKEGRFQEKLAVYSREGEACSKCGFKIRKIRHSGRSTFFCPSCQK